MDNKTRADLQLKIYTEELLKWNKGMNLIGRSTEKDFKEIHIKDCLALYQYLKKENIPDIIDIGSGGGIPGVPLSILMPDRHFYLTDVDSKKLAFLEFITKKLKLNADVIDMNRGFRFEKECVIISRAFSSVKNIVEWSEKHAPERTSFFLLKGREEQLEQELKETGLEQYELIPLEKGNLLIIR